MTGLLGPAAGMAARAAVGAAVSAGEQVVRNKMEGKPLGDGVLLAAGIGGAFGALGAPGVGRFMGKVAGRAGGALSKVASKALNRGGKVCALSFSPDTAVATPDGAQAIGTLEEGDQVEAYDPATGTASTQTVEHVWINHDDDLIDLTLRSDAGSQTRAVANASTKQQEVAVASHGTRAPPPAPARQPGQPGQRGGAPGFADETVHTTAKHPWLTMNRDWVQASDLQVGEQVIRLDGGTATITAVQVVPGAATMYNLQVSHLHTFAVGTGQYVVHNCGGAVRYGSTKLSRAVQQARILARERDGNFAAAELDDGSIITARSITPKGQSTIHAERTLIAKAGGQSRKIVRLYSEREPCGRCATALLKHNPDMDVTWTWKHNFPGMSNARRGRLTSAVTTAIRRKTLGLF